MSRRVGSAGPKSALICLVGEAPGVDEERMLQPFKGKAGKILDAMLKSANIKREECYITNVAKIRPPNNVFYKLENIPYWVEELKKELQGLECNVIVALGDVPLTFLTEKKGIGKWRGSILPCTLVEGMKVVATEHPAYYLPNRKPSDLHLGVFDLERALDESSYKEIKPYKKRMIIDPSFEQAVSVLDGYKSRQALSVDIETNRVTKAISCIGVGYGNEAICIPMKKYGIEEEVVIWNLLQNLLLNPDVMKIGQNFGFDMTILYPWVGECYPLGLDTMLAHHVLNIEDPHGLDHLTSVYTTHPYYKDEGKTWKDKGDILQLWEYNCTDVIVTYDIAIQQMYELREQELERFYYGYVMPLWRLTWRMQMFGCPYDMESRDKMAVVVRKELEEAQIKLEEEVGHPLNVSSPKQMARFLYEELKLPVQRHRKTGSVTADERALEVLGHKYPSPVFNKVLEQRGRIKTLGTYLDANVDSDGRMRTSYLVSGTDTGRLSSRKGIFGSGMDLQNIPENLRFPFVPDDGMVLVEADLSQAENRIVAYLADEQKQMEIFEIGGDFHSMMAEWLRRERKLAKKIVHGTNYGMKKRLLSQLTGLSEGEAQALRMRYFATCPMIERWQLNIQHQLKQTRTLTTPLGRVRVFNGLLGDDMYRKAYAYIPQSTVGDWLNINLVCVYHTLKNVADILLQVHDSMLLQCKPDDLDHVIRVIKYFLERPMKVGKYEISIPCDIKVGNNWGDMNDRGEELPKDDKRGRI